MKKPRIIIDDKIPYIHGFLEPYSDVVYLSPELIVRNAVCDVDALIVRTRTLCNEALLSGSGVKFIGTATIGYDHIDTDYCDANHIVWKNAPGCNASSVGQYVASAVLLSAKKNGWKLGEKTIGIVGVGHVGKWVEQYCRILGMNVVLNDPVREINENSDAFDSLDAIAEECDIITFHTPLTRSGQYATFHLADERFFRKLRRKPVIMNTSRGEVVDNIYLLKALSSGLISDIVMDCWEGEPRINEDLLDRSYLGTPHIAGYSADGKAAGTKIMLDEAARFFGWEKLLRADVKAPEVQQPVIDLQGKDYPLGEALWTTYNPETDSDRLKQNPGKFEWLRSHYGLRREFQAYQIKGGSGKDRDLLEKLGFSLIR